MKKVTYTNKLVLVAILVIYGLTFILGLVSLVQNFNTVLVTGIFLTGVILSGVMKKYRFTLYLIHFLNIFGFIAISFQLIMNTRLLQEFNLVVLLLMIFGIALLALSFGIWKTVKIHS